MIITSHSFANVTECCGLFRSGGEKRGNKRCDAREKYRNAYGSDGWSDVYVQSTEACINITKTNSKNILRIYRVYYMAALLPISSIWHDPFIVKNVTFGIEDSLISTTGVLVGVAAAKFKRREILVTGFILILVEAMSMAYGAFLSDENFMKASKEEYTVRQVISYALFMFISYFLVGLILLIPFALNLPRASMWVVGIALTLLVSLIMYSEANVTKTIILTVIGAILMSISYLFGGML